MTDNVTYSNKPSGVPGGTVIKTDYVDGSHIQYIKLDVGADGASSPFTDPATGAKQDDIIAGQRAATGFEGGPVTVGTAAVEMTFTGTTKSISIMSDHDNAGKVWWGGSDITNDGSNALGRLGAGQSVTLELDDSSAAVYAVSDTAGQTVYKVALT